MSSVRVSDPRNDQVRIMRAVPVEDNFLLEAFYSRKKAAHVTDQQLIRKCCILGNDGRMHECHHDRIACATTSRPES